MRLRRLELVVLGVTLAFACFMGGFFTGRSWSAVNIVAAQPQQEFVQHPVSVAPPSESLAENSGTPAPENQGAGSGAAGDIAAPANEADPGQVAESAGAPRGGDGRININLASQSELMDLPGIGAVLASRIVDYRRQHGDFRRIEDIRNVSGIGEKRYEAIQDKITVG